MKKTQIIILAAGKGTRMKSNEPKALTPLNGKCFLERILNTIKEIKLDIHPIIVIGHQKEKIIERFGTKNIFAIQKEQLGTGHAVLSAQNKISPKSEALLILSVDQPLVSGKTIKALLKIHFKENSTITMASLSVPDFKEWRKRLKYFGRIKRDKDEKIEKIIEYKDATKKERSIKELNPAVYVFNPRWLRKNISLLKNKNQNKEYYLTDLIQIAKDQGKKIESKSLSNLIEGLQPNTKEEVAVLEKILEKKL